MTSRIEYAVNLRMSKMDRGELHTGDPTLAPRQVITILEVALAPYGIRTLGGEEAVVD